MNKNPELPLFDSPSVRKMDEVLSEAVSPVSHPVPIIPTIPADEEKNKEDGLEQVESHSKGFVEKMREIARSIASEKGRVSSDDLRTAAIKLNIKPHHSNCWGSVFNKEFVVIDRIKSSFTGNHSREIKVWSLKRVGN